MFWNSVGHCFLKKKLKTKDQQSQRQGINQGGKRILTEGRLGRAFASTWVSGIEGGCEPSLVPSKWREPNRGTIYPCCLDASILYSHTVIFPSLHVTQKRRAS